MFSWFKKDKAVKSKYKATDVGAFYNETNDAFLQVYGDIIQAFRTTDVSKILDYEMQSIGIKNGQKLLDAGCGVCGPAIYFASKEAVSIDALTISSEQKKIASERIEQKSVKNVKVMEGDYHILEDLYPVDNFDKIYFLESFGHSPNQKKVLESCWKVLKPGGEIYIKDLFRKIGVLEEHQQHIDNEIEKINKAYFYNVADLNQILDFARKIGYVISFVKTIDIRLDDFENLAISNEFQNLTGIGQIESFDNYIFPIDFFEMKLYKPLNNFSEGIDRYFLQNLYQIQIEGKKKSEL